MDHWRLVLCFMLVPILTNAWSSSIEELRDPRELRRGIHYHSKRHMLPADKEVKKRSTTPKPRDVLRKKPSGHLTPLEDDDMDNDEVVSVAIGPPPLRSKYDKITKKTSQKKSPSSGVSSNIPQQSSAATNMVRDVLTQLGREFLTAEVGEHFVFGQFVGLAMKNLTRELKLNFQHDVMELIIRYQKWNNGDKQTEKQIPASIKEMKLEKRVANNETDENWPDFSNLEKIVG